MPRRPSPAQIRNQIRQAQRRQKQALKRAIDQTNRKNKQAVDQANRRNKQRFQQEVRRLASTRTTQHVVYRRSVVTLTQRFSTIESAVDAGTWVGSGELLDLAEGEAANSVAVLRALDGQGDAPKAAEDEQWLQVTTLSGELSALSSDLEARWGGALYALSPQNPDAARHFCTSAREIVKSILEIKAPDDAILAVDPEAATTDDGSVTRRAKVGYLLDRKGTYDSSLADFVDSDVENVLTLFREFNNATHGSAGRFDLTQLVAIKNRVEDAVRFLYRIVG